MERIINIIRDWSEVWALLIPLTIILLPGKKEKITQPIIIYVFVGLILSLISTTMFVFHQQMPAFLKNNNIIYNIHSFIRVLLFSWYIFQFRFHRRGSIKKIILLFYLVFVFINFIFWESPLLFSSSHFIAESIVLLICCISFFFNTIQDDSDMNWLKHPAFLVCAGLSLYEAVNFFTFLFFNMLSQKNLEFLKIAWTIHNITFVILCIMLALSLYNSNKQSSDKPG